MLRDYLMSAAIFSLFSFIWFGWAQETLTGKWRLPVAIISVLAALTAGYCGYLSYRYWHSATMLMTQSNYRWYLIFVVIEFILAGGGALLLYKRQRSANIAPWISLVIGSHFIVLEFIFRDPSLYILAGLMISISLYTLLHRMPAKSVLVGVSNGVILLSFAIYNLSRFWLY
ncbi:hypothetical protein [Loigolactobacillus zhaoyuanensis]|uniref:Uncharacterized protein n=1 Tax=Loigolactobacillus zhaoyuanensis TaxID=2486017 RepID=A0ABW8UDA0_9LACO|nr:hypothetical protein [Loigolactobacillus zhaoyuanensis]